jgi:hypothetical protein
MFSTRKPRKDAPIDLTQDEPRKVVIDVAGITKLVCYWWLSFSVGYLMVAFANFLSRQ